MTSPEVSDTPTEIPGTTPLSNSTDSHTVRSDRQDEFEVAWDAPTDDNIDIMCKHI